MSEERHPREVLKAHGLKPRRALGQNFLVAARNIDRVVEAAAVTADQVVLEIGTGMGRLTHRLAERARHVVSVELDRGLHAIAADRLAGLPNVTLLHCDFLAGKHRIAPEVTEAAEQVRGDSAVSVVSNLPYCISSPAIVNLLEWDVTVDRMCMMIQAEVADRLAAHPGTKQYGPLTVFVGYWAQVEILFGLPRRAFWPVPEVSSTLVQIARRADRQRRPEGYDAFVAAVRGLFSMRRKMLRSALKKAWDRQTAERVLAETGLGPERRVDTLTSEEFEAVARVVGADG